MYHMARLGNSLMSDTPPGSAMTDSAYCMPLVQVQTVSPYSASTQSTVLALADDSVYNTDTASDAVRQILSYTEVVSGDASQGLIATIDAIVNTSATYTSTVTAETSASWNARLSLPIAALLLLLLGFVH